MWPSAVLDASQSCALDSQQDRIVVGIRLREDVAGKREAIWKAVRQHMPCICGGRSGKTADAQCAENRDKRAEQITRAVLALFDVK